MRSNQCPVLEGLIVVLIIGLMAAISIPKFTETKEKAQDSAVAVEVVQEIEQTPLITAHDLYFKHTHTVRESNNLAINTQPGATTTTHDLDDKHHQVILVMVWLGFIFATFFLGILKEKV